MGEVWHVKSETPWQTTMSLRLSTKQCQLLTEEIVDAHLAILTTGTRWTAHGAAFTALVVRTLLGCVSTVTITWQRRSISWTRTTGHEAFPHSELCGNWPQPHASFTAGRTIPRTAVFWLLTQPPGRHWRMSFRATISRHWWRWRLWFAFFRRRIYSIGIVINVIFWFRNFQQIL